MCIRTFFIDFPLSDYIGLTFVVISDGSQFEKIRRKVSCRGEKLQRVEGYLRELEKLLKGVSEHLRNTELQLRAPTPVGPEADSTTGCYVSFSDIWCMPACVCMCVCVCLRVCA